MLEEGLYSRLTSQVIGIGSRVYPLMIPQHVYDDATKNPCLVYQRSGAARVVKFCNTDELVHSSFQIDAYARSFAAARVLADGVRDALLDFTGTMGTTQVSKCLLDSELDLIDPEPGLYRVSQSWSIWYVET